MAYGRFFVRSYLEYSSPFIVPKSSLPWSQESVTSSYPESVKTNALSHTLSFKIYIRTNIHTYVHTISIIIIICSTALCWALVAFSLSWFCTESVGLLGHGISPLQGLYLHTEQHKHRINAHNTDIHDLSGIRTHDLRVRPSDDSPCLTPRGHSDRHISIYIDKQISKHIHKYTLCQHRSINTHTQ
jgi:hypothetical protein